ELSYLSLDKNIITVPNSGEGSVVTVNAKTTDQYELLFDADIAVEKADSQYPDIITSTKTDTGTAVLTIDAAGIAPGQYLYNISADGIITKALTVIVGELVTVTFDANGHGTAPEAIPNVVSGTKIAEPAEPIAEGWLFAGWYKDTGLTQAWDFTKDVVTEDITLYARWRQDDASGTDHSGYMWWESTDTMPSESGNYYLANDVTLSSDWTVSDETVLCLNDHVLNLNGHHIIVDGSLTFQDCGETIRKFADNSGLWTLDQSQGTKSVTGGVITGGSATDGGAVLVNSNASFTMDGGNIVGNNSVDYGGGVRVDGGCFTMLDGIIAGNTSARGGGIYVSGTMNMSGGTIDGNTASAYGGGIYTGTATVSVTGGLISNNKATGNDGGGIGIAQSADVTLENCTISGNTAKRGGGVYDYGKLTINEGTLIKNNSAATYGGGVYANTNSTLNMTDGEINENNSSSYGGGVYVNENSTLNMTGGEINENNSSSYGGGVYVNENSTLNMTGGEIIKNKGTSSGGGIYSKGAIELGGTAVIKDNTLTKNENNIRKYSGTLSISDETPPESGMEIGFHGEGTVATNAHPGDELFFFADDSAKGIAYSNGKLITVDAVAAIGSRGYASVVNAIAVAKMGDTVKLLADNSESFVLPVNVKFDINGNNYTGTVFAPDRYEVVRNGNVYSVNCKGLIVDNEEEVFGESTLDSSEKSAILDELVNNDALNNNNISEIEGVEKLETSLKSIEATKDEDGNIIVSKITYDVTPKDKDGNEIHEPLKPITFNLPLPEGFGEYADYTHGEDKGVVAVDKDTNSVELTLATFSQIELTPHKHSYTDGECECGEYDPINNKLHLIPDDEGGFKVLATGKDADKGVVIVAFYDNEGLNQLLNVKTFDLANGEMPTGKFIGNGYVKAMWWSDLGTMTPLCEAVEED
ncbi:MAG: InlB B-repeat-containing protein, partial [Prevotellaceae bacterium]|nr:InlB B-repeat-containing protein [Prevotellaceae bacterium]